MNTGCSTHGQTKTHCHCPRSVSSSVRRFFSASHFCRARSSAALHGSNGRPSSLACGMMNNFRSRLFSTSVEAAASRSLRTCSGTGALVSCQARNTTTLIIRISKNEAAAAMAMMIGARFFEWGCAGAGVRTRAAVLSETGELRRKTVAHLGHFTFVPMAVADALRRVRHFGQRALPVTGRLSADDSVPSASSAVSRSSPSCNDGTGVTNECPHEHPTRRPIDAGGILSGLEHFGQLTVSMFDHSVVRTNSFPRRLNEFKA